jgi:hypothetical protein
MKTVYQTPVVEVITFAACDVLTNSTPGPDADYGGAGDED